jgi:hypothetical protein
MYRRKIIGKSAPQIQMPDMKEFVLSSLAVPAILPLM